MDMQIAGAEDRLRDAQVAGPCPGITQGRLRGFFHHFPEMASQQELARALHEGRFRMHHDPSGLRPGQPRGHTDLVMLLFDLGQILAHA